MIHPTLHYKAGFPGNQSELGSAVRSAQQALSRCGFHCQVDGLFGDEMRSQVYAFQMSRGLTEDGIIGPQVWAELMDAGLPASHQLLVGFRGDLAWIHAREGHSGQPYWPGGESGITLDPGVDLGYVDPYLLQRTYSDFLTTRQMQELQQYLGLKGEDAREALLASSQVKAIVISWEQAAKVFPHTAEPYWSAACHRFESLPSEDIPPSVQTAMLSLAYNRGPANKALMPLESLLLKNDWQGMADCIDAMQEDHPLPGIQQRRHLEAELVRQVLRG